MTDAQAWRQFIAFQKRYERKYQKRFYQLFRQQAKRVAAYIRQEGLDLAEANISTLVRPEEVEAILRQLYTEVGARWASIEADNIQEYTKSWTAPVRMKIFGFNSWWESILNIYFSTLGGRKITKIDETTRQWLIKLIQDGRNAQLGPEQIARSMERSPDVPLWRSRLIARTETVGAANMGGLEAARQSKLKMNKRWVNAHDKRVRETHKDQDQGGVGGEVVPQEQPFSNGLMHPGDPKGEAKEVCNCRCLASMRPVRDANGMPVTE